MSVAGLGVALEMISRRSIGDGGRVIDHVQQDVTPDHCPALAIDEPEMHPA